MKISFVGFGNMAKALAQHLIKLPDFTISASAPSLPIGKNQDGIYTQSNNRINIQNSDIVILAVKPQIAVTVLQDIASVIPPHSVLLSIATGINLASLAEHLPDQQPIIRSMPNIPIAVGEGATPLIANSYVTSDQKNIIQRVFEQAGIITWLNNEKDMDLFTAISGSGPAYILYFLQAMIHAGEKLGLETEITKQFVFQTAAGALALAKNNSLSLEELRKKIIAPAGTTAAAMTIFEQNSMDKIIFEAIEAAFRRAQILGLST